MSDPLVPDNLWKAIAPLLPKRPPKPKGGRPQVPDRAELVLDLQAQGRRLQQEITDLTGDVDNAPEGDERRAEITAQLTRFEDELEQKQRELARYQGRI